MPGQELGANKKRKKIDSIFELSQEMAPGPVRSQPCWSSNLDFTTEKTLRSYR